MNFNAMKLFAVDLQCLSCCWEEISRYTARKGLIAAKPCGIRGI